MTCPIMFTYYKLNLSSAASVWIELSLAGTGRSVCSTTECVFKDGVCVFKDGVCVQRLVLKVATFGASRFLPWLRCGG